MSELGAAISDHRHLAAVVSGATQVVFARGAARLREWGVTPGELLEAKRQAAELAGDATMAVGLRGFGDGPTLQSGQVVVGGKAQAVQVTDAQRQNVTLAYNRLVGRDPTAGEVAFLAGIAIGGGYAVADSDRCVLAFVAATRESQVFLASLPALLSSMPQAQARHVALLHQPWVCDEAASSSPPGWRDAGDGPYYCDSAQPRVRGAQVRVPCPEGGPFFPLPIGMTCQDCAAPLVWRHNEDLAIARAQALQNRSVLEKVLQSLPPPLNKLAVHLEAVGACFAGSDPQAVTTCVVKALLDGLFALLSDPYVQVVVAFASGNLSGAITAALGILGPLMATEIATHPEQYGLTNDTAPAVAAIVAFGFASPAFVAFLLTDSAFTNIGVWYMLASVFFQAADQVPPKVSEALKTYGHVVAFNAEIFTAVANGSRGYAGKSVTEWIKVKYIDPLTRGFTQAAAAPDVVKATAVLLRAFGSLFIGLADGIAIVPAIGSPVSSAARAAARFLGAVASTIDSSVAAAAATPPAPWITSADVAAARAAQKRADQRVIDAANARARQAEADSARWKAALDAARAAGSPLVSVPVTGGHPSPAPGPSSATSPATGGWLPRAAAGAGAGFLVGGPVGAIIGAAGGALIGRA